MPDRPHHTEKMKRCVEEVMAKGHEESSAYAICTASLQDAGEPIFEGAKSRSAEETRLLGDLRLATLEHLHLLGATGKSRLEQLDGREHLVVPVVALMEGVIHAVNAATPELVPLATLRKAAASWNGRPVTLGHPTRDGRQCSANSPDILASHGIGRIFNSRVEGQKMLCEAWLDRAKVAKLAPGMLARLLADKPEEVSVGALVVTGAEEGTYNGKPYRAKWLETSGDHLAFLPGGRGACSLEMGCGAHRAAQVYAVTEEGLWSLDDRALEMRACVAFTALEGPSLDERIQAVNMAVSEKFGGNSLAQPSYGAYAQTVFDDRVIVRKGEKLWSVPYTIGATGSVEFGEPVPVRQAYVAAAKKMMDCPTCEGSGSKDGNPCPTCDGSGEVPVMKAAAGARHSAGDMGMIQAVHDHAVALGATCDRSNYKAAESPALRTATIRHEGGRWVLYSKDGSRRLGTHDTEAEAVAQERAVEAAKNRRSLELAGATRGADAAPHSRCTCGGK